jgi:Spy/CpxP family protein refolding chaperone
MHSVTSSTYLNYPAASFGKFNPISHGCLRADMHRQKNLRNLWIKKEEHKMKKFLMVVVIIGLTVFVTLSAFCEEKEDSAGDYGYGYHIMGSGYGMGMGSGYMMGEGNMQGRGWRHRPGAWKSLNPEQREKWQKMRAAHMMDTLDLRMKLAAKRVELRTLWAQPEIDNDRINKLSNEVSELQVQLLKMRNQHLLQCRQKFGGQGWDCPGGW